MLLWELSFFSPLSLSCGLETVLKVAAFEVWKRSRCSHMKRFFLATWGEAWMPAALLL
jgi:hypothetical protein